MSKQLVLLFLLATILSGCATNMDADLVTGTQTGSKQELMISSEIDGDSMIKHEILRMSCVENQDLILVNSKNEKYLVPEYGKYDIEFTEGQRVGISYTSKEMSDDGRFIMTIVFMTKESNGSFLENGL